jgi:hypothetical protein
MPVYRLTRIAEAGIVEILAWSETRFGIAVRRR